MLSLEAPDFIALASELLTRMMKLNDSVSGMVSWTLIVRGLKKKQSSTSAFFVSAWGMETPMGRVAQTTASMTGLQPVLIRVAVRSTVWPMRPAAFLGCTVSTTRYTVSCRAWSASHLA